MELADLLPLLQLYGVTSYKDKTYDLELQLLKGIPVLDDNDSDEFGMEVQEIPYVDDVGNN
tara:strand:+ start:10122 stop:10304 length:183 start_codon:yes stop_codon:yes gene_type:complete